jgi:hypothetical protein
VCLYPDSAKLLGAVRLHVAFTMSKLCLGGKCSGKYLDLEEIKSVRNLGYYVIRNVAISTDQAVL